MDTEERIKQLEDKAIQVNLQPTEQENLKNNIFDGINGQNLKITWKKNKYEIPSVGVVTLTDNTTVTTDCTLGNEFHLTTTQNFTMANPTGMANAKLIMYKIKQDSTGSRVITWGSAFRGSNDLTLPTLTTTANYVDYILFHYDSTADKWNCLAVNKGFAT